ncbi:MAG TPA: response regulator transcription factor [Candidatus Limnocylindrales bacterium]|jgi:DNA-binding NarL/FixJ family response regulator
MTSNDISGVDHRDAASVKGAPSHSRLPSLGRPIRIALVDDHHVVREGLRLVLAAAEGFEIVGEAATRDGAAELVAATRPDVLLLDLTLPEGDAIPLLRTLRATHRNLRVIVLTMHSDPETVRQSLAAGARGYLIKGAHSGELIAAVRAVARGDRYLHSSVTGAVVDDSIRLLQTGRISGREREILTLLASGLPAAEIGRRLDISVHTVRRHVANLSTKLGIRGTVGLTRYAIRHGLVRDE